MKKCYLFFLYFLCITSILAQNIEVKKFEQSEKDETAVLTPREDFNGVACGLVKVALKEDGAEFEGNIVGNVQFTGAEYLVYLANGTKRLGIKHPDYLPTTIIFGDYGTKKVASSKTYDLKLKTNKKKAKVDNSKKGIAVFNIKPSNAVLLIDGQKVDGTSGIFTISLPYGTHFYSVMLKDFSINHQSLQIDKNPKNINLDLTDFFARVDVSCETKDAFIMIDNELMGEGKWGGMMIPGSYSIEVQKDGCHSQIRQIELRDNDTLSVSFPQLKTITGSLRVDFEPAGCDVLLNGKKVGVTPLFIKDLAVGSYNMEISKEYYIKEFYNIKINEDQESTERGELKKTEFGQLFVNAVYELNSDYVADYDEEHNAREYVDHLMNYYKYGHSHAPSGIAQYFCSTDTFHIPINPVKAVSIFRKLVTLRGLEWEDRLLDDVCISLNWAREVAVENEQRNNEPRYYPDWYNGFYAPLAWHLFYGIGCEKDVAEAIRLIKRCCTEDGEYRYPAYIQLIKDMGLENELKYNPELDCHRLYCPKCSGPQYIQDGTLSWRCTYCGYEVTDP